MDDAPWDEVSLQRIPVIRGFFPSVEGEPSLTLSETVVLKGTAGGCSFSFRCNVDGTADGKVTSCGGAQLVHALEAFERICPME